MFKIVAVATILQKNSDGTSSSVYIRRTGINKYRLHKTDCSGLGNIVSLKINEPPAKDAITLIQSCQDDKYFDKISDLNRHFTKEGVPDIRKVYPEPEQISIENIKFPSRSKRSPA